MLKDAKNKGAMVLRSVDEIPTGDSAFSAENTAYIERAFIGSPSKGNYLHDGYNSRELR